MFLMILETTAKFFVLRFPLPLALISCVNRAAGQGSSIDSTQSRLLIHVSKSGVFSGFAERHALRKEAWTQKLGD